jgi:hypothetical protein
MLEFFRNTAFNIVINQNEKPAYLSFGDMQKALDAQAVIRAISQQTSFAFNIDRAYEMTKAKDVPGRDPREMVSVTIGLYAELKTMERAIEHIRKYPHDGLKLDDTDYASIVLSINDGINEATILRSMK